MIILPRNVPIKISMLEGILRRLPELHPDYRGFMEWLGKQEAGYRGEKWVDSTWLQFNFTTPYALLHDYQVIDENGIPYQMDTVFISPYFALILEIKNISGRLDYDAETHQCIWTKHDGTKKGFVNAIDQVRRHARFLKKLFEMNEVTLPIEFAVVLSNSATIIGNRVPNCPMLHVSGLYDFLLLLFQKHNTRIVDDKTFKKISSKLSKMHSFRIPKIQYPKDALTIGVLCDVCQKKCYFNRGKWYCDRCKKQTFHGFINALNDYRLLFNESFSNQQFREFFGIDDIDVAYRLIKTLNLQYSGKYRDRKYYLPIPIRKDI